MSLLPPTPLRLLPALMLGALLTACGGGGDGAGTAATAQVGSGDSTDTGAASTLATAQVRPTYHLAPVLLDAPADTDMARPSASARMAAVTRSILAWEISSSRLK